MIARKRIALWLFAVAFAGVAGAGCSGDDDDSTATALTEASLSVYIVPDLNDDATPEPVSVPVTSQSNAVLGTATADPGFVPVSWGDPTADPSSDFMLLTVQIDPVYLDKIKQVEVTIQTLAVHEESDTSTAAPWCNVMQLDATVDGLFYLKLQPACLQSERDPVTGQCIVCMKWDAAGKCIDPGSCDGYSSGCREDQLTFSLWDDITTDCHD